MKRDREMLEIFWEQIPVGKYNAVSYDDLCDLWGEKKRAVRSILHDLSLYDNGDDYILIRSSSHRGFYRTDDEFEIEAYKRECLSKGKSVFAPVKKINRVINSQTMQTNVFNNLKPIRYAKGLTQSFVVKQMRNRFPFFDEPLLSKIENGMCLPTPAMVIELALILDVEPADIFDEDLFLTKI